MNSNNNIFSEFQKSSKKEWIDKAILDLKGADFDKKLVWKTYEKFNLQPFYTEEDTKELKFLSDIYKTFTKEKGVDKPRFWVNYREVIINDNVKRANEEVIIALNGGADGILFDVNKKNNIDFDILLKGVSIEYCAISFKNITCIEEFTKNYFTFLSTKEINIKNIRGFIQKDIISDYTVYGRDMNFDHLSNAIKISKQAPFFYTNVITSHHLVDSGCNYTQEIAFVLNKLTDYIEKLGEKGLSPKEVLDNTMFDLAMGGDYFFDIAKYRVVKILLLNIVNSYDNLDVDLEKLHIMGSSSKWTKTIYDPNVNMLRNTSEAMSAIIGGVNSIFISPYDSNYKMPNNSSNRISLNISNLLKEESYFDIVVDPVSGSYFLENLSKELIKYSLDLFKEIEKNGGFLKNIENNNIQNIIKEIRDKKIKDIAYRKMVFVGSNKYPDLKEKLEDEVLESINKEYNRSKEEIGFNLLKPQRAIEIFEKLRTNTEEYIRKTGKKPHVYLALFGNLAMRKARSTFSSDFFGTVGFDISENFFDSVDKMIEESSKSKSDIVVICSSDDDYKEFAKKIAKEFKAKSKDKFLVLAGLPENQEELKLSGIDQFINIKSNVVEVLEDFQKKLGVI